jgi:putative membrane protein
MKLPIPLMLIIASAAAFAAAPDASFYKTLAQGGIAEVEAGKLAQQKGADPKVKDFGAMMVKDHSAANEQLKALAAGKGIDLPGSSSTSQMAAKAKLEVLSGGTFDKSYVEDQVKAHRETVELLKKEIATGQDPDAKAFAQKVLPTVESHLRAINQIAAAGGKG